MSFKKLTFTAAVISAGLTFTAPAHAGTDPYVGEVMLMGNNFCPRGWAKAEGQLLAIASNNALFSLYGTIYGGDGRTTFGLPALRGRVAINYGNGPGLPNYNIGTKGGSTSFTMNTGTMPSHTHQGQLRSVPTAGNTNQPARNSMAMSPAGINVYSTAAPANNMNNGDVNILNTGSSVAVNKRSPINSLMYCVALVGIYPSRN